MRSTASDRLRRVPSTAADRLRLVQRSVIVTPDQGYGDAGYDEVPGNATLEMQIEVLEVGRA